MWKRIRKSLFGGKDGPPPLKYQSSQPVVFSFYADGAFEKHYTPWRRRVLEIQEDGTLRIVRNKNNSYKVKYTLHLSTCIITLIDLATLVDSSTAEELHDNIGIKVECQNEHDEGLITSFRCLLPRVEAIDFSLCCKEVSKRHNVDMFLDALKPTKEEYLLRPSLRLDPNNVNNEILRSAALPHQIKINPKLKKVMKRHEKLEVKSTIANKRGAFQSLPILFSNDLIHGSWWFVVGSLFVCIVGAIVLATTYHDTVLGEDDSNLSVDAFRAVWALLIASGAMFTIGSVAFLRAVNDPPMKPLFPHRFYHIRTDALFGAWCFFLGVAPAIPYALIFLAASGDIIFLGMLFVAIFALFATYLFVKSCYPENETGERRAHYLPYLECLLCHRPWVKVHCATDFLAAMWIIYWATWASTVLTFLYTIYGFAVGDNAIVNFVNVTGLIDCIMFLIGSAYFVAGAYTLPKKFGTDLPFSDSDKVEYEHNEHADDDDDDDDDDEENQGL